MLDAGKGGPHIGSAILRGGGNSQGKQKESKTVSHFKPLQNQNGRPWQRYQVGSCYEAFPLPGRSFRRRFDRRRRELRMIITAAHVIRAMIPASVNWEKRWRLYTRPRMIPSLLLRWFLFAFSLRVVSVMAILQQLSSALRFLQ
jgi:hypothetical protein